MNPNRSSRFANRPYRLLLFDEFRIVPPPAPAFSSPPPAPAFTFIYCAVTVNAPADRFQEDSSDLANVLFRLLHHRARWRLFVFAVCDGRQAAGCACVSWSSLIFHLPTYVPTYVHITYLHIALTCGRYDFKVK